MPVAGDGDEPDPGAGANHQGRGTRVSDSRDRHRPAGGEVQAPSAEPARAVAEQHCSHAPGLAGVHGEVEQPIAIEIAHHRRPLQASPRSVDRAWAENARTVPEQYDGAIPHLVVDDEVGTAVAVELRHTHAGGLLHVRHEGGGGVKPFAPTSAVQYGAARLRHDVDRSVAVDVDELRVGPAPGKRVP